MQHKSGLGDRVGSAEAWSYTTPTIRVMDAAELPITPLLPRIRASLREHPRLVLEAPPGAGKTTQAPPALLDEA